MPSDTGCRPSQPDADAGADQYLGLASPVAGLGQGLDEVRGPRPRPLYSPMASQVARAAERISPRSARPISARRLTASPYSCRRWTTEHRFGWSSHARHPARRHPRCGRLGDHARQHPRVRRQQQPALGPAPALPTPRATTCGPSPGDRPSLKLWAQHRARRLTGHHLSRPRAGVRRPPGLHAVGHGRTPETVRELGSQGRPARNQARQRGASRDRDAVRRELSRATTAARVTMTTRFIVPSTMSARNRAQQQPRQ
jgi:hypothetical protein